MSVAHILGIKGRNIVSAKPDDSVGKIVHLLAEKRIGAVVITSQGAAVLEKPASAIMTQKVLTCRDEDSEQELMALMTTHRIRHLPVVRDEKLVGMISIGDVVKHRIEAIEREAEDMKAYIASAG
jgi:CBS domain-containing protein